MLAAFTNRKESHVAQCCVVSCSRRCGVTWTKTTHLQMVWANCGVTWTTHLQMVWAKRHTKWSKMLCGAGPQLKYATTAWTTLGSLWESPCLSASSHRQWIMFCLRKDKSSVSSNVIMRPSAAAIFQKENLQESRDHPMGGGGMLGKLSKIVILCYYVSIFYPINYYKNIQNIKNCQVLPTPPTGGGVWCDIPAMNLELPLTRWHDWKEVNKYGGSRPRGQSLLRYQPVCLWYHYNMNWEPPDLPQNLAMWIDSASQTMRVQNE